MGEAFANTIREWLETSTVDYVYKTLGGDIAEADGAEAAGAANTRTDESGGAETGVKAQPPTVRKEFPETWIWTELTTSG